MNAPCCIPAFVLFVAAIAGCSASPASGGVTFDVETAGTTMGDTPPEDPDPDDEDDEGTSGGNASTGSTLDESGDDDGGSSGGVKFDLGSDDVDLDCVPDATDATLTGTVHAPEGTIPISGALVSFAASPPEPIPDEVYCNDCVEIDCETPHVLTEADGSFSLPVPSGTGWLVVEKGQFRRVVEIDVAPGDLALSGEQTRLPDHRDEAAGLYAPNIALGYGTWDRLEDLIAKLGLGTAVGGTFQPGGHHFDVYSRYDAAPGSVGDFHELLHDLDAMRHYHIIFFACDGDWLDAEEIANVRTWASEGGRFYATDLEAFKVDETFGQYQTFEHIGALLSFDWPGRVEDEGLLAWLQAQGHGELITLHDNASQIAALHEVLVRDEDGELVDVGHTTLLSAETANENAEPIGGWSPAAVMGQYGCGRVAYSTYHTTSFPHGGFEPQELTMLYLILEIGVCQDSVGTPEG